MSENSQNDSAPADFDAQILAAQAHLALLTMAKSAHKGDSTAQAAFSEAATLVGQVCQLAQTVGPCSSGLPVEWLDFPCATTGDEQVCKLEKSKLRTNCFVRIRGALDGDRCLDIAGLESIRLGKRMFVVLRILARHAFANPGAFTPVNDIVIAIEEEMATYESATSDKFWEVPVAEDVRRVVSELRDLILHAGGNAMLIESCGTRGGGYRLSTPADKVTISEHGSGEPAV